MVVREKYTVQKSFYLDTDIERDLAVLSKMTNRSQNEIVRQAIIETLGDNKYYFLNSCVLEHFEREIENADDEIKDFELGGLEVKFEFLEDDSICVSHKVLDKNRKIVEEHSDKYKDSYSEDFKNHLIGLGKLIDVESDDTKEYLADRTDYRDYVKVRR